MHLAREEGRAESQSTMRMPTGEIPRFSGFGGLWGAALSGALVLPCGCMLVVLRLSCRKGLDNTPTACLSVPFFLTERKSNNNCKPGPVHIFLPIVSKN